MNAKRCHDSKRLDRRSTRSDAAADRTARVDELFRNRDTLWGDAISDWFNAEQELIWKPAIELREKDGAFVVSSAVAGVDPHDLNVDITPENVVIKGETKHEHKQEEGQVHRCEFTSGQIFRSVQFPKPIDVAKAKAEYRNGLLTVTAPIAADAQVKKLEIRAA